MSSVVHALLSVPPLLAYLLVGLLAFGESAAFVGFVLPGETALLFGGLLAAQGKVSLPVMMALGICAAVAGDSVGYQLGRALGPGLQTSRLGRRLGDQRWARAQAMLLRAGGRPRRAGGPVRVRGAGLDAGAGGNGSDALPHVFAVERRRRSAVGRRPCPGGISRRRLDHDGRALPAPGGIPLALMVSAVLLLRVLRSSHHRQRSLAALSRARGRLWGRSPTGAAASAGLLTHLRKGPSCSLRSPREPWHCLPWQ